MSTRFPWIWARVDSFKNHKAAVPEDEINESSIDRSVDDALLDGFGSEVQFIRIPEDPKVEIEIDFWVPALPPRIVHRQWQHLLGVRVMQAPWAAKMKPGALL